MSELGPVIQARGRIKTARRWFAIRKWKTLPQGDRGQRILELIADHAWLAYPSDPKGAVRRICGPLAPWADLDQLIARTINSNKRWSNDQCAAVLEISVRDSQTHSLRFVGAHDDPEYQIRAAAKREKNAARARNSRAAKSTGRPRGRPKSEVPAWVAAGSNSERSYYRHKARGTAQSGSKNASRHISNNKERDGISLPPGPEPAVERGAPQAPPSRHPEPIESDIIVDGGFAGATPPRPTVTRLEDIPDGLILDQAGDEYVPPELYQQRRPKTWMDAAFEGYKGERP
jgi:hypothetical protein